MGLSASTIIHRPPSVVWRFIAVEHVRNHPRWDPSMELRQLTDGPMGAGTRIGRRHTRTGAPIEGTMEVVEFVPERTFGTRIQDRTPEGPLEVRSAALLEPAGEGGTRLTFRLELPSAARSMDRRMVEASLSRIKELIEAGT